MATQLFFLRSVNAPRRRPATRAPTAEPATNEQRSTPQAAVLIPATAPVTGHLPPVPAFKAAAPAGQMPADDEAAGAAAEARAAIMVATASREYFPASGEGVRSEDQLGQSSGRRRFG